MMVEYVVILLLIGVATLPVFLEVGLALAGDFDLARSYVLGPVP